MHKSASFSSAPNMADTLAAACGRPMAEPNSYKSMTAISQANFSVLAKVVTALKKRFLNGYDEPVSIQELLDETGLADAISRVQREWLIKEALKDNVRVRPIEEEPGVVKYQFRPVIELNVKDKNSLKRFLQEQYEAGNGPTSMIDILESLPRANKRIKQLKEKDQITVITRSSDKKEYVVFNDGKQEIKIDEDFIKLWRSISVEGVADEKIEEYLEKQGIQSIKDLASRQINNPIQKRRKVARRQNKNFKAHNEHMKDILEDYSL